MREPNLSNIVREYVEPKSWLRASRNEEPTIIIIHATRGHTTPNLQYLATKNWVRSTQNNPEGDFSWGSSCDFIIGNEPGEICQVGRLSDRANWSAGYGNSYTNTWGADTKAISIEVAQSAAIEHFDKDAIENLTILCVELVLFYNIPVRHITYLSQTGNPPGGFVGHDETANGVKLGKSDPGDKFPWDSFIREVNRRVEERRAPKPPAQPKPAKPAGKAIKPDDSHNARNDFTDLVMEMYNGEAPWDKAELDKFLKKWGHLFR